MVNYENYVSGSYAVSVALCGVLMLSICLQVIKGMFGSKRISPLLQTKDAQDLAMKRLSK